MGFLRCFLEPFTAANRSLLAATVGTEKGRNEKSVWHTRRGMMGGGVPGWKKGGAGLDLEDIEWVMGPVTAGPIKSY
jgi:hypothetical protein